jgi:hypothetical protein
MVPHAGAGADAGELRPVLFEPWRMSGTKFCYPNQSSFFLDDSPTFWKKQEGEEEEEEQQKNANHKVAQQKRKSLNGKSFKKAKQKPTKVMKG